MGYVEEQEQLRQEYDSSASDDEDLHIEIPKEPEVNPEVYQDIEPLLFRGFLCVSAEINGVQFVFKSLNHHEYDRLKMLEGAHLQTKAAARYFNLFLAYGVAIVDGVNILSDRDAHLPDLVEMFETFSESRRKVVIRQLSEINRRANKAIILTEAYAYELQSRLKWAQLRGTDLTATAVTGFDGTAALGMNWGQLAWRALNYFEDVKETSEREWENTKFVASALAGKGMRKIYNQDKERRKQEREERAARKDKILRLALLGEPLESKTQSGGPIVVAKTMEDLTIQLEHDLKGEKDWHDMIVEDYEQRVRLQHQERLSQVQELRRASVEEFGDKPILTHTSMLGLTKKEVEKRLLEKRQRAAGRLSEEDSATNNEEFIEKWIPKASDTSAKPKFLPFKRGS